MFSILFDLFGYIECSKHPLLSFFLLFRYIEWFPPHPLLYSFSRVTHSAGEIYLVIAKFQ